jgi:hypothetical protein
MDMGQECYRCIEQTEQGRSHTCPDCRFVDFYPPAFCFSCVRDGLSDAETCVDATGFAPQVGVMQWFR